MCVTKLLHRQICSIDWYLAVSGSWGGRVLAACSESACYFFVQRSMPCTASYRLPGV
jgi:hypothetical protein